MMKIFLTNLAKYNAGELSGKWIELPMDADELQEEIDEVLGTDEEYFITDYETELNITVEEYTNIHTLNEQLEGIEDADETTINALIYVMGTIEEAKNVYESGDYSIYHEVDSEEDLGYEVAEETGMLCEVPDNIKSYFDYEKFGRDLTHDGYTIIHELQVAICTY